MFDDVQPLVKNMVGVTGEMSAAMHAMNQKNQLTHMMDNIVQMSDEVNLMLPQFRKSSPQMADDLGKITHSVAVLSVQLEKTLPLLAAVTPDLPKATRRAFEALDETVVTLKALQKSFLIRGSVREVRQEELAQEKNEIDDRLPANETPLKAVDPKKDAPK